MIMEQLIEVFIEDENCPKVPRGYKTYQNTENGVVLCIAPEDKRKSKGRVPPKPKRFFLMEKFGEKGLFWIPENDYPTRGIREFVIAQGLETEIKYKIKKTHKAPKCSTILRQEYGMTGTPASLLEQWLEFRQIELHPPKNISALKEIR